MIYEQVARQRRTLQAPARAALFALRVFFFHSLVVGLDEWKQLADRFVEPAQLTRGENQNRLIALQPLRMRAITRKLRVADVGRLARVPFDLEKEMLPVAARIATRPPAE